MVMVGGTSLKKFLFGHWTLFTQISSRGRRIFDDCHEADFFLCVFLSLSIFPPGTKNQVRYKIVSEENILFNDGIACLKDAPWDQTPSVWNMMPSFPITLCFSSMFFLANRGKRNSSGYGASPILFQSDLSVMGLIGFRSLKDQLNILYNLCNYSL